MRTWLFPRGAIITGAIAFLASCSAGSTPPAYNGSQVTPGQQSRAIQYTITNTNPADLAVVENSDVVVLNNHYGVKQVVTSTTGNGAWYDKNGNLYLTQSGQYSGDVQEYSPTGTPLFTYPTAVNGPAYVKTDGAGRVYVGESNGYGQSQIEEFAQQNTVPIASCTISSNIRGVARDYTAGVFVSTFDVNTGTSIQWYRAGLNGCPTPLSNLVLPNIAGFDMIIDANDNLLVCDGTNIDVIAAPYNAVTSTISAPGCTNIALNAAQDKLYVSNPANSEVDVLKYPSGTPVTVLNGANGITSVSGGIAAYKQTAL